MRRSFWVLTLVALAAESVLAALAVRALLAQLPCHVRGWYVPVSNMGACVTPMPVVGRHALGAALVVGALALVSLLLAGVEVCRQVWRLSRVRQLMGSFPRAQAETPIAPGAPRAEVVVLLAEEPCCFTVGLVRPEVVVSTGLLGVLGPEELAAALSHEAAHARRLDPLRRLLASVAAAAVFFVPVLRDLETAAQMSEEVTADRVAVARHGEVALLSALHTLLAAPQMTAHPHAPLSGMAGSPMLEGRLAALAGHPPHLTIRWPRLLASVVGLVVLGAVGLAVPSHVSTPPPLAVHFVHRQR